MDTARLADISDLTPLIRLWSAAVAELDGRRGGSALADGLDHGEVEGYLSRAVEAPDHLVVIGLLDDRPVGLASLKAGRHPLRPVGELELIYVEPAARRGGVAESMFRLVTEQARVWGMTGIEGPALPGDRATKSFFESQGYTARLLVMYRTIESEPI